jgi:hypothetical protein
MRATDGGSEVPLRTYQHFADRDPLARVVLERMLAGVSTRRYRRTQEPVGEDVETEARSTSKSAVSRTFVERARQALGELINGQLSDLRLAVMMLDGLGLKGRMMIVALRIATEGVKIPLGLWEGSTENATVATAARGRDRTPTPPSPAQPRHDPGGRDRSQRVTITPGPSSPKFHDARGNLSRSLGVCSR